MNPRPMEPATMTDASTILLLVASVVVMAGFTVDNLVVRSRRNV